MENGEKIFLAVAGIAIVALVLWQRSAVPTVTQDDGQAVPAAYTQGPAWLMYNQPWGYNAALGNPLPTRTNGQVGQVQPQGDFTNFANDCGCN